MRHINLFNLLIVVMVLGLGLILGGAMAKNEMLVYVGGVLDAVSFLSAVVLFVIDLIMRHRGLTKRPHTL